MTNLTRTMLPGRHKLRGTVNWTNALFVVLIVALVLLTAAAPVQAAPKLRGDAVISWTILRPISRSRVKEIDFAGTTDDGLPISGQGEIRYLGDIGDGTDLLAGRGKIRFVGQIGETPVEGKGIVRFACILREDDILCLGQMRYNGDVGDDTDI